MIGASVVKIEIFGGYQGGAEPWERIATLRVDAAGVHDTHPVGRSGDRAPLSVSDVASALVADFEPGSILQLLDHLVELRTAVRETIAQRG